MYINKILNFKYGLKFINNFVNLIINNYNNNSKNQISLELSNILDNYGIYYDIDSEGLMQLSSPYYDWKNYNK